MKRILLVNPAARRFTGNLSTHRIPLLATAHSGLPLLAAILRARGHAVRVVDEQLTPFRPAMLDDVDLLGVSVQTSWAPQGYRIARAARDRHIPVVLGGAHASLAPDEAIEHADFVVRNEGERTLPELLDALDGRRSFDDVLGLTHRREGKPVHNAQRPFLTNDELDQLPLPDWSAIDRFADPISSPLNRFVYFTLATRGCPFGCNFCSITPVFGRGFRHRSVSAILDELRARFDPERQFLFFLDDSLAVGGGFLNELLTRMRDEKLTPKLGWHSQMRVEAAADPETVRLMKETNCWFATFGFESINPRTLAAYDKGQSVDDIRRAIARLRDAGIVVNGFFVLGSDDDDRATVEATLDFAISSGCLLAGFMPLTPFPGTPLHARLDGEGRILTRDWELYDVQHVVFRPARMSPLELYRATLDCYRRFYARMGWRWIRESLAKKWTFFGVLVGGTWPVAKMISWGLERLANLDYERALARVSAPGSRAMMPTLSDEKLWRKDLLTLRPLKSKLVA